MTLLDFQIFYIAVEKPPKPDTVPVIILANHHSGSTFLGEFLNRNKDGFYIFEPLEGLYNGMYGTKIGQTFNLNIWNYMNHSLRFVELIVCARVFVYSKCFSHKMTPHSFMTRTAI